MTPPPISSVYSQVPYSYSTETSLHGWANITWLWWWIPAAVALVPLVFFLRYFSNRPDGIRDIESGLVQNEVNQPALEVAAAPTKPGLTGQALEEAFPTFTHGKIVDRCECGAFVHPVL
ncbi:hypothetical protein GH714_024525 [Hevea brasiliensis]|uniref:Uncharacterized protein n=1 Tax=Hevea brasiliensis TaxID=3981 RepID=A0A6A6M3D6_HEVBR|nr:hypothetical protein GH714_024525 [Hevea brasiliensis]